MASEAGVLLALCVPVAVPFAVCEVQRRLRRAVWGRPGTAGRHPGKRAPKGALKKPIG